MTRSLSHSEKDVVIIHKCTTVRHALKAESLGVDMISLDGSMPCFSSFLEFTDTQGELV